LQGERSLLQGDVICSLSRERELDRERCALSTGLYRERGVLSM
jgi:hypothetical protein